MTYRIYTNGKGYKIKRKKFGFDVDCGFYRWESYDATRTWCEWYGRKNPYIFASKKEVEEFIQEQEWKVSQEIHV